jgi:hypothetical protein
MPLAHVHTYVATAGAAERLTSLREIGLAQCFQALDPLDCAAVLRDMLGGGMSAEALVFLWGTPPIPPEMYSAMPTGMLWARHADWRHTPIRTICSAIVGTSLSSRGLGSEGRPILSGVHPGRGKCYEV